MSHSDAVSTRRQPGHRGNMLDLIVPFLFLLQKDKVSSNTRYPMLYQINLPKVPLNRSIVMLQPSRGYRKLLIAAQCVQCDNNCIYGSLQSDDLDAALTKAMVQLPTTSTLAGETPPAPRSEVRRIGCPSSVPTPPAPLPWTL